MRYFYHDVYSFIDRQWFKLLFMFVLITTFNFSNVASFSKMGLRINKFRNNTSDQW